jgi:hypothetical protein
LARPGISNPPSLITPPKAFSGTYSVISIVPSSGVGSAQILSAECQLSASVLLS